MFIVESARAAFQMNLGRLETKIWFLLEHTVSVSFHKSKEIFSGLAHFTECLVKPSK